MELNAHNSIKDLMRPSIGHLVAGKPILDIGCDIGLVAFHISGYGIPFYIGLDENQGNLHTATHIFSRLSIDHIFQLYNPAEDITLLENIPATVDVVLYLDQFQKLVHSYGEQKAVWLFSRILHKVGSYFICRTTHMEMVVGVAKKNNFDFIHEFRPNEFGYLSVFKRK